VIPVSSAGAPENGFPLAIGDLEGSLKLVSAELSLEELKAYRRPDTAAFVDRSVDVGRVAVKLRLAQHDMAFDREIPDRLSGHPKDLVNRPSRTPDLIRDFRRPETSVFSTLIRAWSRLTGPPLYLPSAFAFALAFEHYFTLEMRHVDTTLNISRPVAVPYPDPSPAPEA
jgi:hypothetical protein